VSALQILLIHNPTAGKRRKKRLQALLTCLRDAGYEVQERETKSSGDARQIATVAIGFDLIIAAGGDGTANDVVNGLCQRDRDEHLPTLLFFPLGTQNVLAKELDLPAEPAAYLPIIRDGHYLTFCPGIANSKRFLLMASVGLDARAVAGVKGWLKRLIGPAAYIVAAVFALRQGPANYDVAINGQTRQAAGVIVARAQYYGGNYKLFPGADLSIPKLSVMTLQNYGFTAAMRYGLAMVMKRMHNLHDVDIEMTASVEIRGPGAEPVQIDGDVLTSLPLLVSLEKREVKLLIPKTHASVA